MKPLALAAAIVAVTGAIATGHSEAPAAEVRASIARVVDRDASPWAATVRDPETTITRVASPASVPGAIWRIERFMPTRALIFYVAVGAHGAALLTGRPEAFNSWIRGEGATVRSSEDAVELARLFVEATRNTGKRTQIIDSVDSVPFKPGLAGTEAEERERVRREFTKSIQPAHAVSRARGKWEVIASAVEGMNLVRLRLSVAETGQIETKTELLRENLPLVYAN